MTFYQQCALEAMVRALVKALNSLGETIVFKAKRILVEEVVKAYDLAAAETAEVMNFIKKERGGLDAIQ